MQTECCACGVDMSTPLQSTLNLPLVADEVPSLRTRVGWPWNDADFPALFGCCQLWASRRDEGGQLVRFDYMVGMGLEHGYLADVIVEPVSQRRVGSAALVPVSLAESERRALGPLPSASSLSSMASAPRGFAIGCGGPGVRQAAATRATRACCALTPS